MHGLDISTLRVASRGALLVGIAGMAATVVLLDRIAAETPDSMTVQGRARQYPKSRISILTRVDDGAQSRPRIDAPGKLSLPPYFPLE